MASGAEQIVSQSLRAVLADLPNGASIADTEQFRVFLTRFQWFLPEVLVEVYPEWNRESLDGVVPLVARKPREGEAEIFGLCILISDQTVTPLHLHLEIAPSVDEISWLECRLGERGENGMVRTPYDSLNTAAKRLYRLECRHDRIDWVYKVTFGDKRA
jgi:hypothetical protein